MEYAVYKLNFTTPVHFGEKTLESANMTFSADRLFSALAFEAAKESEYLLANLIDKVKNGKIIFSDAFPFNGNEYYCPKPMIKPVKQNGDEDILNRKRFKKLEFLPISKLGDFVLGKTNYEDLKSPDFGKFSVKTSVSIEPDDDPKPFRVCLFSFNENSGLYVIVGYEEKSDLNLTEDLLKKLSFSGIGGKRSTGLGRFKFFPEKLPQEAVNRLNNNFENYMTLSAALPTEEDMTKATEGARYLLEKKSGFVASPNYSPEWRRKRDSFVFKAGSVFKNKWKGELKDVSENGNHAVYRYSLPMFMGVD